MLEERVHEELDAVAEGITAAVEGHLPTAEIVRQTGQLGEIVAGAFADLLIVDGDPTRDLGVFQDDGARIPGIMKGGRFVKNAL